MNRYRILEAMKDRLSAKGYKDLEIFVESYPLCDFKVIPDGQMGYKIIAESHGFFTGNCYEMVFLRWNNGLVLSIQLKK